jgi:hypothetical protein
MALMDDLPAIEEALAAVQAFGAGTALTARIADLETRLQGKTRDKATALIAADQIDETALSGALTIKQLSVQIDVVIHALGILTSLPYILEPGEVIESLSLGAGNTGRHHDLVTDRQIAEFKFIQWRGGSEAIRQNNVFIDIFNLARESTKKRRVLYLLDKHHALRFLRNRRAIASVLSKNFSVHARFRAAHHDRFATVRDYWATVEHRVEIIDLRDLVPAFKGAVCDRETSAVPKDPLK